MITKARIKFIKSLSDKEARKESGLFVAEGRKMVAEALSSGLEVEEVFASSPDKDLRGLCGNLGSGETAVEVISAAEMARISHLKTPSEMLALVRMPRFGFDTLAARSGLLLALDGVQDPGNVGTIIRLADWFGIKDVVCSPSTADCFNPKVVQATMGAIFRVRVHYAELVPVLGEAAAAGCEIYGTMLEGENIYNAKLSPAGIIVMGSEGKGVSPAVREFVGRQLYIPPYPAGRAGSESLNVAVATAIVCSEFRRREV